jgi:hypothetical protein
METRFAIAINMNEFLALVQASTPEFVTSNKTNEKKVKCTKLTGLWSKVFEEKINDFEEKELNLKGL